MKLDFNYSDEFYRDAVNCEHTQYSNYPMTVKIKDVKYILPCGASDKIWPQINENLVYVVGENSGLGYIGLVLIDTEQKEITQDIFIQNVHEIELTEDIFNLDTQEQINILSNWFD